MALILITLFLVLAVVLRAAMQRIRTGDFGLRAASLDAPLVEILPGTLFVLSFASALILVTLGEFGYIAPITSLPYFLEWLFFALGVTGVIITVVSQHQIYLCIPYICKWFFANSAVISFILETE